jgi:hypothetical protein
MTWGSDHNDQETEIPLEPLAGGPELQLDRPPARDEGEPEVRRLPLKAVVLLLALLGLVGWEVAATLIQRGAAPTQNDWKAAAAAVRSERKADEPVLFAPGWVEPLGRLHLGDQLSLEQQLLSDVDRYARIWEVSVRGARHEWLASLEPARSWDYGAVTVALFTKPAQKVLFDFTAKILEARVDRHGPRHAQCRRQGDRFSCDPQQSWNWVGPHLAEVGHRPYRCVFAHPVDGHVIRIAYPAVPMGGAIVGYTGIDDFENRKRADKPVTLKVYVGPRLVGVVVHQNRWAWRRFTLETKEITGQTHPVRFEVSAEAAYARSFCFSAEARE